jgi:hypothetical protein
MLTRQSPDTSGGFVQSVRFVLLCAYLSSQIYLIPVAAAGPGWPIWPTIADVITGILALLILIPGRRPEAAAPRVRVVWRYGVCAIALCTLSYALIPLLPGTSTEDLARAHLFGALQLLRLLQCAVLFHAVMSTRLDIRRMKIIGAISGCVCIGIGLGVMLTFSGLVPTSSVSSHLPSDIWIAGPWAGYVSGAVEQGVGFIGFNHAYTGIQLLLSAGLALQFIPRNRCVRTIILGFLLLCTFLSRSRDAFVIAILFATLVEFRRRPASLMIVAACGLVWFGYMTSKSDLSDVIDRQSSSASSYQEDGLSGRTTIWEERIQFLNSQPLRWFVGAGFGSSSGNNAHMLPLHIVGETGLLGLILFGVLHYRILRSLRSTLDGNQELFWAVLALIVSSATQETLYPVIAFPQFELFFVFCAALGLSIGVRVVKPVLLGARVTGPSDSKQSLTRIYPGRAVPACAVSQ